MVYAQHEIRTGKWDTQTSLGFLEKKAKKKKKNGSSNLSQTTRPSDSQQKKKTTCRIVDFSVLADHKVKLKESEKKENYLDLTRELKWKLLNMKVTVIPIVISALGTVSKRISRRAEEVGYKRTNDDNPNYCNIKIG